MRGCGFTSVFLAWTTGHSTTGYTRTVEFNAMLAAGREADILIGLTFRPGDFVIEGGGVIGLCPGERATEEIAGAVREAIVSGAHRTPVQDPDFSIRHLVEIAVHALSPGINDP